MKRPVTAFFALLLCLSAFTGCKGNDKTEDITYTSEQTESAAEQTEKVTEQTSASVSDTLPAETVPETELSETESKAPDERSQEIDLKKYLPAFDECKPLKITNFSSLTRYSVNCDDKTAEAALKAVIDSDFYKEVSDYAKSEFYYENGELLARDFHFLNEAYLEQYIDTSKAPEIKVKPKLSSSFSFAPDGKNTESVLIYNIPLPESQLEWSGTSTFFVTVYVNSSGEAYVLDYASQQVLNTMDILSYENGSLHLIFTSGHTEGTMQFFIYSFSGGKPKFEFHYWSGAEPGFSDYTLSIYCGFTSWKQLAFYDEELGYCLVSGVPVPAELKEMICGDSVILEKVPEIEKYCDDGSAVIIGGKYLTADNCTFVYNGSGFEALENEILIPSGSDEKINVLNIDLEREYT